MKEASIFQYIQNLVYDLRYLPEARQSGTFHNVGVTS